MNFTLVSETSLAKPADCYRLAQALERNAADCAKAYGLEAPTVVVMDDEKRIPRDRSFCAVVLVADDSSDPGALAVHYEDPVLKRPAAVVYVDRASGFNVGSNSVCEAAGHEVLEALCNPRVNLWRPHPDPARVGVQVAYESCDPVQDTYTITIGGTPWKAANFITPYWYETSAFLDPERRLSVLSTEGFDHAKTLGYPGEIGRSGYLVLRKRNEQTGRWEYWYEDSSGSAFSTAPTKHSSRSLGTARSKVLIAASEQADAIERAERETEPDRPA